VSRKIGAVRHVQQGLSTPFNVISSWPVPPPTISDVVNAAQKMTVSLPPRPNVSMAPPVEAARERPTANTGANVPYRALGGQQHGNATPGTLTRFCHSR
jgi:hypothetical protein